MAAKCPGTWNGGTVEQRQTPGTSKSLGVSMAQYVNLPGVIDSTDESWKKHTNCHKHKHSGAQHCWRPPPFFCWENIPILNFPLVRFPLQLNPQTPEKPPEMSLENVRPPYNKASPKETKDPPSSAWCIYTMLHGTCQNYCLKICLNVDMETVSNFVSCVFRHSISFELKQFLLTWTQNQGISSDF